MTRVLANESLTTYAGANYNRRSYGVNGSDHMNFVRVAPVDRRGFETAPSGLTVARAAAARVTTDPMIDEGYSSAAGLGLVLVVATVFAAAAIGALLVRAVMAFLV